MGSLDALLAVAAAVSLLVLLLGMSRQRSRSQSEARAYLAGFTYVLSDDPDAAIAELSRAAELNRQTVETYFALGALFRRKGDLDRAIRLHRNILLKPALAGDVKRRAELELARDLKRAGLRDEAIETLTHLTAEDPGNVDALTLWRQVLEDGSEWARAAKVQARLAGAERPDPVLAHLLARAARGVLPGAQAEAVALAGRAVAAAPDCADAQLALAEAELAAGHKERAAGPLRQAIWLEPELAPRAVKLLGEVLDDPDRVDELLREVQAGRPHEADMFELARALLLRERGQLARAVGVLRPLVERRPRFWEARKELGALLLAQDRSEDLRADYQEILGTLGQPSLGFQCTACRQKLPEMLFRCPSCEQWDVVRRERI